MFRRSQRERDRDDDRDAERQQSQFERRQPAPGVREIGDRHGEPVLVAFALPSLIVPARIGSGCTKTIRHITARDELFSQDKAGGPFFYLLRFDQEFTSARFLSRFAPCTSRMAAKRCSRRSKIPLGNAAS